MFPSLNSDPILHHSDTRLEQWSMQSDADSDTQCQCVHINIGLFQYTNPIVKLTNVNASHR